MPATVIESSVASGTATSTGTSRASSGTAIRASPNPKAERTRVATKTTTTTGRIVHSAAIVLLPRHFRRGRHSTRPPEGGLLHALAFWQSEAIMERVWHGPHSRHLNPHRTCRYRANWSASGRRRPLHRDGAQVAHIRIAHLWFREDEPCS